MQGRVGTRALLMANSVILLMLLTALPSSAQSIDEPLEFEDLQAILDMYDPDTGRFEGLETGVYVRFQDEVTHVGSLEEVISESGSETIVEKTYLILSSNYERSDEVHLLRFHGTEIRDKVKVGARVAITARISETASGNGTAQFLRPTSELELIQQGRDDGLVEEKGIEIFGISIPVSFLPKEYQTPLVRFLIVFGIFALAALVVWFAFMVAVRISRRTKTEVDKKVLKIVTGPFFLVFLLYGLIISVSQFELDRRLLDLLDMIYRATSIIIIAYIGLKVFKSVILVYMKKASGRTQTQADDVLVPLLGKLVTVVIWVGAVVMFLRVFGVDVTVFVAGMGIAGLVIALAAQDTLSNFFAGIMLLLDRPFKEGDWIELNNSTYQVRHIGLRSTRLFHSISNQVITIPNNRISDHMFSNLSEPDFLGRKTVVVGVSYKHDPKKIGLLLIEIVNSHPDTLVDDDHKPHYRFSSFGDSSLNFEVTFWVRDFNDQWRVASEIRERIYERFEREAIEIPFPQRVVHMSTGASDIDRSTASAPAMGDMQNLGA